MNRYIVNILLFQCISIFKKLGLCVSSSAAAKKKVDLAECQEDHIKSTVLNEKKVLEENPGTYASGLKTTDIIGDNFDIVKSPSQMSKEKQRKSWHWFLLLGLQKRVFAPNLSDELPAASICDVNNGVFIPTIPECQILEDNFLFHIMKILVKHIGCFKKYADCLPDCIRHPHMDEMASKSNFVVLDLLDKNENKSEDMISILEHIHHHYIAHTADEHPKVIKKKVFGGDVLTNERAYSAQVAMLNGVSDYDQIAGVIHRPEGLHRMMNLCLVTVLECVAMLNRYKFTYNVTV